MGRIADGFWWWSCAHPAWDEGDNWDPVVASTYVEAADATVVIDALVPTPAEERDRFLRALDRDVERRGLPFAALVTCAWHARSSAELAARYDGTVWMPVEDDRGGARPYRVLEDGGEPVAGVVARSLRAPVPEFAFALTAHDAVVIGELVVHDPGGPLRFAPATWYDDTPALAAWYRDEAAARLAEIVPPATRVVTCGHGGPARPDPGWGEAPWHGAGGAAGRPGTP